MTAETQVPAVSEADRKAAAQDAMNGLNETLWQRIFTELGHEPSLAEAETATIAMSDADILLYI